ncbi:MAG: hypothetical protein KIG59_01015 [Muribaculaceae bacterium]|nr:hypothetical protein [Muribaculaceae bacterium]
MRTSSQILPGIKAIGWVDSQHLPRRVDLSAICGMTVAVLTDVHPIPFFDEPSCECKTQKDGAGYKDTATLKFLTSEQLPRSAALGFVVTDVNDKSYLLGSLEHPHPIVDCEQRTGIPSGDAAGYSYEIKHVSIKSMVPCVI